jgi:hypothetical protein
LATTLGALDTNRWLHILGNVTNQSQNFGGLCGNGCGGDRDVGFAQKLCEVFLLRRQANGDNVTLSTGASGAARAVKVRLVLHGRVNVDNEFNVVHVHATSSNVGGHENANRTFTKGGEVAVTLWLRQVSVQVNRGDSSIRCPMRAPE